MCALAARTADTYMLGSAEKIGAASRYSVLPLDEITAVVAGVASDDPTVAELVRQGVEVLDASSRG